MICKAFGNGSSANIKLSKTQLFKMVTLGRFVPLHLLTLYGLAKSNREKNKILSKLEKYNSKSKKDAQKNSFKQRIYKLNEKNSSTMS